MNNKTAFLSIVCFLAVILTGATFAFDVYDYEQSVSVGSDLSLQHFSDKDYNNGEPTIGIEIGRNQEIMTYSLKFTRIPKSAMDSAGNLVDFVGRNIQILGKNYEIVKFNGKTVYLKDNKNNVVLKDGNEISINNKEIEGVYSYLDMFEYGGQVELRKISVVWKADDDEFITENNKLTMIGLGSLYMTGFNMGKEEEIRIYPRGDDTVSLEAPLKDYYVDLEIAKDIDGDGDFDIDPNGWLWSITCGDFAVYHGDQFVVTSIGKYDSETRILEVSHVDDIDGVTVKDYNGEVIAENKAVGESFYASGMEVKVLSYDKNHNNEVIFSINDSSCANSKIMTKEGLMITLPLATSVIDQDSFKIEFTEEDKDGRIGMGVNYLAEAGFNQDNDVSVKFISHNELVNAGTFEIGETNTYVGYVDSDVSSRILEDKSGDQYSVYVTYPGEETYGEVYIASNVGDVYKFEKSSNKLNLEESLSDIISKLTEDELPAALADGTFEIGEQDSDKDGVSDNKDKCPNTVLPEFSAKVLGIGSYADIDGDSMFETKARVGGRSVIKETKYGLKDTYGCSCKQILKLTPGNDIWQETYGCFDETLRQFVRRLQ